LTYRRWRLPCYSSVRSHGRRHAFPTTLSWAARNQDVTSCHRLAALALALAERIDRPDLRCLASAHFGNSFRLRAAFQEASFRLAKASQALEHVDDVAIHAFVWELWGSLYIDVRDFESAIRVLTRAGKIRDSIGDPDGRARAKIVLGIALGYASDPIGGVKAMREALTLTSDPDLARSAVQCLIRFLVDAGLPQEALTAIKECRALLNSGGYLFRLRTIWHEAKVSLGLGAARAAQTALESLQVTYISHGMIQEAAHVGLDLALAYLHLGDFGKMGRTIQGLEPIFTALGIAPEARASHLLREILISAAPLEAIRMADRALLEAEGCPVGSIMPAA
jgi:tetratricopeptide (TPR) repeat protein